MKHKKQIVVTLVIVMLAVIALSVNVALAAGSGKTAPPPDPNAHPPVCYKVESFAPGVAELQCYDNGKDIVNFSVKTNMKYDLNWDSAGATLRVYPGDRNAVAYWFVSDKDGNTASGQLP
jgi:hypothetical protein